MYPVIKYGIPPDYQKGSHSYEESSKGTEATEAL